MRPSQTFLLVAPTLVGLAGVLVLLGPGCNTSDSPDAAPIKDGPCNPSSCGTGAVSSSSGGASGTAGASGTGGAGGTGGDGGSGGSAGSSGTSGSAGSNGTAGTSNNPPSNVSGTLGHYSDIALSVPSPFASAAVINANTPHTGPTAFNVQASGSATTASTFAFTSLESGSVWFSVEPVAANSGVSSTLTRINVLPNTDLNDVILNLVDTEAINNLVLATGLPTVATGPQVVVYFQHSDSSPATGITASSTAATNVYADASGGGFAAGATGNRGMVVVLNATGVTSPMKISYTDGAELHSSVNVQVKDGWVSFATVNVD